VILEVVIVEVEHSYYVMIDIYFKYCNVGLEVENRGHALSM